MFDWDALDAPPEAPAERASASRVENSKIRGDLVRRLGVHQCLEDHPRTCKWLPSLKLTVRP